jgi:hypothetical protein
VKCGALATPVGFDWDGDGDTDIVSGNTAGYIQFFENLSGPRQEKPRWAAPRSLEAEGTVIRIQAGTNGSIQGPCEAKWGYTTLSIADWDGDKLPDIVANSILGKVHWYRNVGSRRQPKLAAAQPIEVDWYDGKPHPNYDDSRLRQPHLNYGWLRPNGKALLTQWRTTPVAVDWDKDGLMDLVMLDHEGYLAWFRREREKGQLVLWSPSQIFMSDKGLVWDSRHTLQENASRPGILRLNSGIAGKSGRRKLCVTDWDGDGKLDFLVNSANANCLRNLGGFANRMEVFFRDEGPLVQESIEGHDVSPTTVDFNEDGVPDFLGGAEDGRFYYLRNPRSK